MKKLLNILNAEFPELLAVDASEFDNTYFIGTAIWFRGSECGQAPDGLPLFDYYMEFGINAETDGVHPKLYNILKENGFYPEPYDAATLMAGKSY